MYCFFLIDCYIRICLFIRYSLNRVAMPYRRLPNTDSARLKALKIAFQLARENPPFKLAFSQSTFQRVQSFLPSFEKALLETRQSFEKQVEKSKDYTRTMKKAKLYVSHFIQVVNMAIMRGELPVSERNFYKLDEDEKKTPTLQTEAELMEWGRWIIDGEEERKKQGKSPVTNPTIAVVKVRYEQFIDAMKFQKTLQKNHQRCLENLAAMRTSADEIILKVWNEVEEHYSNLPDADRRISAEKYGLVYVFRKSELEKAEVDENMRY